MCSVFLVVLVKLSLVTKRLARKTPQKKPNRGEGIVSMAEESLWLCWFIVFFRCFIARYLCSPPALCDIFPTSMAWYSHLCWKCRKTPTN